MKFLVNHLHFVGIGGAGMSGIALVLHERGYAVTGSDLKTSRYIRQLTSAGVKVHVGHAAATIDEDTPAVVVDSTAIPESNPELVRARELGIPVWPRAKMLSALGHGYTTVAVAGTHGKTTTSSMCATMLDRMGLDPSFLIGGIVEGYDTNGNEGIPVPGSEELNAVKEIAANMGAGMGSSITITDDAGSQLLSDLGRSAIQGVSQYVSKKMRSVKVTLKAGYSVLLLPPLQ